MSKSCSLETCILTTIEFCLFNDGQVVKFRYVSDDQDRGPSGSVEACTRFLRLLESPSDNAKANNASGNPNLEAEEFARRIWLGHVTRCDESYNWVNEQNSRLINQARELTVVIEPSDLSEANRLNGVAWNGRAVLSIPTIRYYRVNGVNSTGPTGWSEWRETEADMQYSDAR